MPPSKRPSRNTGPWSSPRILNSSSPILSKDIHAFLVTAISGWNSGNETYTEAEKRSIIDSLPPAYQRYEADDVGQLKCPLTTGFVLDDPYIKAATQKLKDDITDGYYEKSWLNQAKKAMQERQAGGFASYLEEHAEETFGESGLDRDEAVEGSVDGGINSSDGEWSEKKTAKGESTSHRKQAAQSQAQVLRQKRKL